MKHRLRSAYSASLLTWETWLGVKNRLFVRPPATATCNGGSIMHCGCTLVVTMSAKPNAMLEEESWDSEQFKLVEGALENLCLRNQFQHVVALADVANSTIRKLSQVRVTGGPFVSGPVLPMPVTVTVSPRILVAAPRVYQFADFQCALRSPAIAEGERAPKLNGIKRQEVVDVTMPVFKAAMKRFKKYMASFVTSEKPFCDEKEAQRFKQTLEEAK